MASTSDTGKSSPAPPNGGNTSDGKSKVSDLPTTPDKKTAWTDYDEMIRIKVGSGDNVKTHEIYKGVLKFYSGYFRVAIDNIENRRYAESVEGVISLPEEKLKVFDMFKAWLCTRDLSIVEQMLDKTNWDADLCELWYFGDRRQIPLLQNETITAMHNKIVQLWQVPVACLNSIYDNTTKQAQIRRFVLYSVASTMKQASTIKEQNWNSLPRECLVDIAKELFPRPQFMIKDEFSKMDLCKWHIHGDGVSCPKSTKPTKSDSATPKTGALGALKLART